MGCNVSEVGRRRLENLRFPLDCSWARLRRTRLKYARVPTRFVLTDVRRNSTLCPVNSPTFSQYPENHHFFRTGHQLPLMKHSRSPNYLSINVSRMYSFCQAMKCPRESSIQKEGRSL